MTVTASSSAKLEGKPLDQKRNPYLPATALAALVCCVGLRKRRGLQMFFLLVFCGLGLTVLSGCGSGAGSTGTHGSQIITLTATGGSVTTTTYFTIQVQECPPTA